MSTKLFFLDKNTDVSQNRFDVGDIGSQDSTLLNLRGGQTGWARSFLHTVAGTGAAVTVSKATVTGPSAGVEMASGIDEHWITAPLAGAVTISGTITFNLWGFESNMSANAALNVILERLDSNGAIVSTVVKTAFATELGTVSAVANFTATPTSTSFNKGDRIRARVFAIDAGGTMASGFTASFVMAGATGGASGDSFITFTETFTFSTAFPGGTKLWFTSNASPVVAGSNVCKEAAFAANSSIATAVRNTVAGWTAPLQTTDTAGGNLIEWYSRPLQAVTISIGCAAELYTSISVSQGTNHRLEIARVDGDGTNPTVWGTNATITFNTAAQTDRIVIGGSDLVISNGQRLRFRFYIDDSGNSGSAMVTGRTMTFHYNGTGVGESYVEFGETLAEFVASNPPYQNPYPPLLAQ